MNEFAAKVIIEARFDQARESGAKRKRKTKVWVPPTAADFRPGRVIGIDQSLGACGVVALDTAGPYGPWVVEACVFKTVPEALGQEDSLRRAVTLGKQLRPFLGGYSRAGWGVAHERPPQINQLSRTDNRPESSWLSALALRMVLADSGHELLSMVEPSHWKKIVSGNGRAKKSEAHAALRTWAPQVVGNMDLITNEAKRDGLCIALAALWRHP